MSSRMTRGLFMALSCRLQGLPRGNNARHVDDPRLIVAFEDDSRASHTQPVAGSSLQRVDIAVAPLRILRSLAQLMGDALAVLAQHLARSLIGDIPPTEGEATYDQQSPAEA